MILYIAIGVLSALVIVLVVVVAKLSIGGRKNSDYLQTDLINLRQEVADLTTSLNQTLTDRMDKTQSSMQFWGVLSKLNSG